MENNILSITQLNEYLKKRFENDFVLNNIYIKGEISNFVNHKTGHFYFTLKDENSVVKCVMFSSSASKIKFLPKDGMVVIAHGRVAVFVRDGIYTVYVFSMQPDGLGSLSLAYEQLKEKLSKEGLFDNSHKKPIPKIPRKIGIITAPSGAAIRDIINVTGRRFSFADLLIYPSQVQGETAEKELIEGVKYFNNRDLCDVIIIGRGGGSIEDLWCFNSEALARTIFSSHIPIISAVGHETDFTICDFVCDLRAPTPSAAAELCVPETEQLKHKFNNIVDKMTSLLERSISQKKSRLNELSNRPWHNHPEFQIEDKKLYLSSLEYRLTKDFDLFFQKKQNRFIALNDKLLALNPMSVISRGYSAVYKDNKLIKSIDDVEIDDIFTFMTTDGTVTGKVLEKSGKNGAK